MSHSRFRRTSGLYLDMHGLIFETSICYWQDQPGISFFLTCLASVTRAHNLSARALTQESRESPPLRELACRKRAESRQTPRTRDFALPLSARPCNTPHSSHCQSSLVRRLEQKKLKHSLSRSSVWFFKRLVFRSRSPRFGFVRPVFHSLYSAHHEYIERERKLDRLGDGLRRDRPWR